MLIDYINALFHLIYENQNIFITTLFLSKESFMNMKNWLLSQDIHFLWLDAINEQNLSLLLGRSTTLQIESLLHIDIQSELDQFVNEYKHYTHFIFLPGFDISNPITNAFIEQNFSNQMNITKKDRLYFLNQSLDEEQTIFTNPTKAMNYALFYADKWPGILKIEQNSFEFYPVQQIKEVENIIQNKQRMTPKSNDSYFIHLSDLHLGTKKNNAGKIALLRSLDNLFHLIKTDHQVKVLITGDLMNTPNRKNMYLAAGFMNDLKKRFKVDITFILGNHDMIVHGLNFLRVQKAKVVAYLLDESIKVLEKEKIILIKINSAREGNLARGKVGQLQLKEIDEELSTIQNLHEYQLMVLIHHHVLPITKADFLKKKWNEGKVVGKILDTSKELVDSKDLIRWLEKRHVTYILHGHKHIPFFRKYHQFYIMSCGSSCGVVKEESKLKYLSYNVLKYDNDEHKMKVCLIYYDSAIEYEGKRIEVHLFK